MLFTRKIVQLHGHPSSIISNRHQVFMSHFSSKLFKVRGTTLKHNFAYHPQTHRQTKVVNSSLET